MKYRQLMFNIKYPPAKYTRPYWLKALLTMPFKKRPKVKYEQLRLKGVDDDRDSD